MAAFTREDVELYQPFENEQILLLDSARSLSVQAFLNMCKVTYSVKNRSNAEQMSPTGNSATYFYHNLIMIFKFGRSDSFS